MRCKMEFTSFKRTASDPCTMHLANAIEKLRERHEIDAERERLKVAKTSIAQKAGKSLVSVTYWFQAKIDSEAIEAAVRELVLSNPKVTRKAE